MFLNSAGGQQTFQDPSNASGPRDPADSQPLQSTQYNRLPPLDTILGACDVYFRYCHNQPYSLFHEDSFRTKLSQGEVPTHLLYAFLASTIRYSEDPYFHDKVAALTAYTAQSWKSIVMPWNGIQSDAELSIVQTILLLAIVDYTDGRTQSAWIRVGLAIRLAQDFRLMMEPDHDLPPLQQEERRRVFWSFYICDKLISCGRERPAAILDEHCKVQLPCDEILFRRGQFQPTTTLDKLHGEEHASSLSCLSPFALTTVMASTLGKCAQYALGEEEDQGQGGRFSPWNPRSKYSTLHSMLLQLESDLGLHDPLNQQIIQQFTSPDGVVDQHRGAPLIFSKALFHLCQCLLYHPFLLKQRLANMGHRAPQSFLVHAFNSCRAAASALSRLMDDVKSLCCETLTTFYDPFYGYCTMVAAAIHSLFTMSPDLVVVEHASRSFESSRQNLQELAFYWKSCASMKTRLEDFHANCLRYASLIDPSVQELRIEPSDISDLVECLDYSRMSTTVKRKPPSATAWGSLSQFPSPLFDEFVNLLPFSTTRGLGESSFDNIFAPMTPRVFHTNATTSMPAPAPMSMDRPHPTNMAMDGTVPNVAAAAVAEPMVFPMETATTNSISPTASHHSQRQGSSGGSYGSTNPISSILIQNGELSRPAGTDGTFPVSQRRPSSTQRPWYERDGQDA